MGAASQPIATNGSVTVTGPAGDHQIALSGVAGNCTVSGANPRTVNVPAGGTATTNFSVSCAAYTLAVCDNGPANSGMDFFSVFIPSEGFGRSSQVASGDIVKS